MNEKKAPYAGGPDVEQAAQDPIQAEWGARAVEGEEVLGLEISEQGREEETFLWSDNTVKVER